MSRHGSAADPSDTVRQAYLLAAASALDLLGRPELGQRWTQPSALTEFTTSGLAGHLAAQIHQVRSVLDTPVPDGKAIRLLDHYSAAAWRNVDLNDAVNVRIREAGESFAAEGPDSLLSNTRAVLDGLRVDLAGRPADAVVHLPWVGWSLSLDDFLITRMLEISVHSDDVAVSIGVETPELPASVTGPVLELLFQLSQERHGTTAVLRALSRAERAPASIAAI